MIKVSDSTSLGGHLHPARPIHQLTNSDLILLLDHTYLLPVEAFSSTGNALSHRRKEISEFLASVNVGMHSPYALCVRVEDVSHARNAVPDSVRIVAVAGFPDGPWTSTAQKVMETGVAFDQGANEVDMVFNYRAWSAGDTEEALHDVGEVLQTVRKYGGILKVILEVSELSFEEMASACRALDTLGVDFVKTSSGFSKGGATPEAVAVLRKNFSRGIKLSGGVDRSNLFSLLQELAENDCINLDPSQLRIGSSKLFTQLKQEMQTV